LISLAIDGLLKNSGLNQSQFAEQLGISQSALNYLLHERKSGWRLQLLDKVAQGCHLELVDLLLLGREAMDSMGENYLQRVRVQITLRELEAWSMNRIVSPTFPGWLQDEINRMMDRYEGK